MASISSDIISSEINTKICEGLRCFREATNEVVVKVGDTGYIRLHLCANCVVMFQENDGNQDV